jgi:hypothetical protein
MADLPTGPDIEVRRHSADDLAKPLWAGLTRWDLVVLGRGVIGTLLALALVALITAASDEGGLSWAQRAGRALPLSPFCAAIGVWGALGQVKARGEALALAALGRTSRQISAAAVSGALLVCLASCVAIATVKSVDVASFYPSAGRTPSWQWRDGGFADPVHGFLMTADGTLVDSRLRATEVVRVAVPPLGRVAAALATALAGVALALLSACALLESGALAGGARKPRGRLFDALACALAAVATVVLFQVAAARRAPALVAPVPALALAAFAARRYYGSLA